MTKSQLRRRLDQIEARLAASAPPQSRFKLTDEERLQGILRIYNRYHAFTWEVTAEEMVAEAGANGYEQTAAGAVQMLREWREAQSQKGASNGEEEKV